MKKMKQLGLMLAITAFMSGCSLTLPVNATSNPVGSKTGSATATGFFGFIFIDQDASISKAAKNAGITRISTVDVKMVNVLGIITNYTTIVTGE